MSVDKAAIKNALLRNLYDRVSRGKGAMEVAASALRRQTPEASGISTSYVTVLLETLVDAGYVRHDLDYNKFSITEAGIDLVESGWVIVASANDIVDSWSKPDGAVSLAPPVVETVQLHLRQCILLINSSGFSQEEKAQICGLLRICEQIIDLPTPKLGLLKRILGWLKEVKELVPLVEAIFKLMGKN